MSNKFYLITNWEQGTRNGVKITANGLEVETNDSYINPAQPELALNKTNNLVTLTPIGYKIVIENPTGSAQQVTISGSYDNPDYNQIYNLIVNTQDSIEEVIYQQGVNTNPLTPGFANPFFYPYTREEYQGSYPGIQYTQWLASQNQKAVQNNVAAKADELNTVAWSARFIKGYYEFSITLLIPANTKWYLYASDGGYLPTERFYKKRVPAISNANYITELFRYNKMEDLTDFFLPLIDSVNLLQKDDKVSVQAYVAAASEAGYDFESATWYPISSTPTIVTRSNPYFRFKIIFPNNKVIAISKMGYAVSTDFGYSEPVELSTVIADVEQTVYRPKIRVRIGNQDVTRWCDNISGNNLTLNIRKIDELPYNFVHEDVIVELDGSTVMSGKVTGIAKQEYPNAVTYGITFTPIRDLLGTNYVDNTFAFNIAPKDLTTTPYANEYEFINSIVAYSPASNGIILNTEKFKNLRSMKFWTDSYDSYTNSGGMGLAERPTEWTQFYTNNQKYTIEIIEQIANANRLTANVTHQGTVILSDLIPHDECTLEFNNTLHEEDTSSLLSKCTHIYHMYKYIEDETINRVYIPDHRLYVPDVNFNMNQVASLVRVEGTEGSNQVTKTAEEEYIAVLGGFDTGNVQVVEAGKPINYKTQLTYRQPSDEVRFALYTKNKITNNYEQTVLKGTPKTEGWNNVTYVADDGGVFQPTVESSPAGLKVNQRWINGKLSYDTGEQDDVYGAKFLDLKIWTDDLQDEPARQGFWGAVIGFAIAVVVVAVVALFPSAIPLLTTVAGFLGTGGTIAAGTVLGAALGAANGTFVSKINVNLPIMVKGIPAIKAHQTYTEAPLIGMPDPEWFPMWAKQAYQEVLAAKSELGVEVKTVTNPYVVSLSNYRQPTLAGVGGSQEELKKMKKYSMYHKDLHDIVASGLTLREWLKSRTTTLQYAGNPNWYPNQFIAIAKPPKKVTDPVTEYEYFYTLSPQNTSILVGGEVRTSIEAAYIGSSTGNTNIRKLEVLNNKIGA